MYNSKKEEKLREPWFDWAHYDDMGSVMELGATYDDALKKNPKFLRYSVMVANRICEDLGLKGIVTWGKWGGRLEPMYHREMTSEEVESIAKQITNHRSWKSLMESTWVFTYGKSEYDWANAKREKIDHAK